jgi:hypothetical protein
MSEFFRKAVLEAEFVKSVYENGNEKAEGYWINDQVKTKRGMDGWFLLPFSHTSGGKGTGDREAVSDPILCQCNRTFALGREISWNRLTLKGCGQEVTENVLTNLVRDELELSGADFEARLSPAIIPSGKMPF